MYSFLDMKIGKRFVEYRGLEKLLKSNSERQKKLFLSKMFGNKKVRKFQPIEQKH